MNKILIHCKILTDVQKNKIEQVLKAKLQTTTRCYQATSLVDLSSINSLSHSLKIDINQVPNNFNANNIALIISDMDSTLINIECIDEIADFADLKPQVANITEQAMRGELDFNQSLLKRVKLLKNIPISVLDKVYQERLQLNSGAENLIKTAQNNRIKFALVSGGFNFFTNKLQQRLSLNFVRANQLDIKNNKLTGKVAGDIINAAAKKSFLNELCKKLMIKPKQTIAIGDGANDLEMMSIAGLSVAYRAKPSVQSKADVQINYGGLDTVLDFLTIKQ